MIVVEPMAIALAVPLSVTLLEIVAISGLLLFQVTLAVIMALDLSEYLPMAVNGIDLPAGTDGSSGVTAIDRNTFAVVKVLSAP